MLQTRYKVPTQHTESSLNRRAPTRKKLPCLCSSVVKLDTRPTAEASSGCLSFFDDTLDLILC